MAIVRQYPEISVIFVPSESGTADAQEAFSMLEVKIGSLKGRTFYGVIFGVPPDETYWACVQIADFGEAERLGLETYRIPAGQYAQEKLWDWSEKTEEIGEIFGRLAAEYEIDHGRPALEFYVSMRELRLRLPVKEDGAIETDR